MKTLSTLIAGALLSATVSAQGVITLMSNGQASFNYDGDLAAMIEAADQTFEKDTIILGGGTYDIPANITVDFPVVIIGTGFRPDSSAAYNGGRTVLTSTTTVRAITFLDGADGSELHGLVLRGSIEVFLGSTLGNSAVDGFRVKRCEMDAIQLGPIVTGSNATNALIEESVIDNLDIHQSTNAVIRSCFIKSLFGSFASSNTLVENSVFLGYSVSGNINVTYRNCIFSRNSNASFTVNEASTFQNCVFAGNGTSFDVVFGPNATNAGGNQAADYFAGNFPPPGAVMPNIVAPAAVLASFTNYNVLNNYNVGPNWSTAGLGGTPVGVYGGATPWKDGSLPFNPHWTELTQTGSTTSGTLQGVTIRGSAQTH